MYRRAGDISFTVLGPSPHEPVEIARLKLVRVACQCFEIANTVMAGSCLKDIVVGQGATADYTFYFKVENMKMLDGDYDVAVSSKSISHFKNKKLPVEYWIALEPDSTITK